MQSSFKAVHEFHDKYQVENHLQSKQSCAYLHL